MQRLFAGCAIYSCIFGFWLGLQVFPWQYSTYCTPAVFWWLHCRCSHFNRFVGYFQPLLVIAPSIPAFLEFGLGCSCSHRESAPLLSLFWWSFCRCFPFPISHYLYPTLKTVAVALEFSSPRCRNSLALRICNWACSTVSEYLQYSNFKPCHHSGKCTVLHLPTRWKEQTKLSFKLPSFEPVHAGIYTNILRNRKWMALTYFLEVVAPSFE